MKKLFLVTLVLLSLDALSCTQSAQFIAKLSYIKKTYKGCSVYIQSKDLEQLNPSHVCPLVPGEVIDAEIKILSNKDYYCSLENGDFISGVLVKIEDGTLTIE